MLIIKFIVLLIMSIGLICTLGPRLYGTVIIFLAAIIYALVVDVGVFQTWVATGLLILTLVAELGVRGLRVFLTKRYEVSRIYSVNSVVCNVVGSIISGTLLGSLLGLAVWQGLASRVLYPRLDLVSKVLVRLMLTAAMRFFCGFIMVIIAVKYMLYLK
ncbi:MAG: DUF456 family protein [Sporomusaceae bacterium]|nr:DUF456 family protein [Sporomusaceae bacterium]